MNTDLSEHLNPEERLNALGEIRTMMNRSSRFLSLSGLSGIAAGLCGLAGAAAVPLYLNVNIFDNLHDSEYFRSGHTYRELFWFFMSDALLVLMSALILGSFFSLRKARRFGHKLIDHTSMQFMFNIALPLVVGGVFCLLLIYHNCSWLVPPATLVFYGMTLFNAGKFTLDEVRYLGVCEMLLGLVSAFYIGYGLLFWAIGFGVLHIIYGALMWWKYERN